MTIMTDSPIRVRFLEKSDLPAVRAIDRSDHSSHWCVVEGGKVIRKKREFLHIGFTGSDWDGITGEWRRSLDRGEIVLAGAFRGKVMVGVAGLDTARGYGGGDLYNFGPMWVTRDCRGTGIGSALFRLIEKKASNLGITALYVSATPVPATVGFYFRMGCRLLDRPDPELYAREPEDIHLWKEILSS